MPWAARASGWLRASRGGLFAVALVVGAGSGLGAVAFRYLIYFFTWLATGHAQFGQQGRVGSAHFPGLGLGFFVVIPVIGGLIYGPLIYRYAREARGHGVPEVMIAVAEGGGRIRPQVAAVKSLASALTIGTGGSVGREARRADRLRAGLQPGPVGEDAGESAADPGRLRRGQRISATFNAPLTGVFFGVEIILREFSVEAIFTVMLSAMIADLIGQQFAGSAPFLSGLPPGIALHHLTSYLLIAGLAVIAALIGLAFAKILYATEDLCNKVSGNRPEWARPAAGGIALGLLLLALPQMYGVGYPVLYQAVGGSYALWFLIVLAAGKIIACSLTIGIGGSGGVFAPSLFIGATSGMAFGEIAGHLIGPAAGQPALYAVVAMGAVFASAARAPLTAVASVVEMTGDYTLTLPVMLAVAIATALSRALSYGTIYTTKLLRRGTDIDHPLSADPFEDLTASDAMHHFPAPLAIAGGPPDPPGVPGPDPAPLPGPVTHQHHPQMLFASESLTQALRQLELYGRDGLPVISADGQHLQGWITSQNVLQAVARHMHAAPVAAPVHHAAAPAVPGPPAAPGQPPDPLRGYQILEITISAGSPANGQTLGDTPWPPGWIPVTILDNHTLRDPDPGITLAPGNRVNLLAREPRNPKPADPHGQPASHPDGYPPDALPAAPTPAPASGEQPPRPDPGPMPRSS